jgi:hypothetical protein
MTSCVSHSKIEIAIFSDMGGGYMIGGVPSAFFQQLFDPQTFAS